MKKSKTIQLGLVVTTATMLLTGCNKGNSQDRNQTGGANDWNTSHTQRTVYHSGWFHGFFSSGESFSDSHSFSSGEHSISRGGFGGSAHASAGG